MKLAWLATLVGTGCLGPQVADTLSPSGDIVTEGARVPSIDEDADAAATLAEHDGVTGVVPRMSAFAAGAPLHVWDFGPATELAAPLYLLVARQPDGSLAPIEHPPIVAAVPGDASYSPFRAVFALVITDAYAGEQITSTGAIEEAVAAGLVEPPLREELAVHAPIVASDVRLDVGTATPQAPTGVMYYRHQTVAYFDLGSVPTYDELRVPVAPRYVLRRDGHAPLSEPMRGVDLDGDGDKLDTNDVYERTASDPFRTPLCRTVDVVVPESTASIDTSGSEAIADLTSATQLFAPGPVTGTVLAFETQAELRDCAAQRAAGQP